jgi:hypothetical protein
LGAVKREVYNVALMKSADYSEPSTFRRLFLSYFWICDKCESGDQVAMAIKIDLDNMLGLNGMDKTPLEEREIEVLKTYLIAGYTQEEVGKKFDLHQTTIGYIVDCSLDAISEYLSGGD